MNVNPPCITVNCDSVKLVFFPLFNAYYKVVQYSNGHAHNYERGVWNMTQPHTSKQHDITLLLSGGGGAELSRYNTKSRNYPKIFIAVDDYSYAIVDVTVDDQSYKTEVYTLGKPEHPSDIEVLDSMHFRLNQPPQVKPETYPVSNYNPVIINSSLISGPDSCMSSEVQVTATPGNYTNPIVDTTRNWENYFNNTGPPDFTPINLNAGINLYSLTITDGKLNPGIVHGFRVRYRDMNFRWSEWSDEKTFLPSGINDKQWNLSVDMILRQNYPNPFTDETMICFELKTAQFVAFDLFNTAGELVTSWPYRKFTTGTHEFKFSAYEQHLPAGIYFLHMKGKKSEEILMIQSM